MDERQNVFKVKRQWSRKCEDKYTRAKILDPHPEPWKSLPGQLVRQLFEENNGSWTPELTRPTTGFSKSRGGLSVVQINAEASFDSHDRHDQRRPKKRSIRMRETAKVGDQNHAECRLEITQDKRMGVPDLPPHPGFQSTPGLQF